jgi:outer membrane biogenesis lipoprotein LolB
MKPLLASFLIAACTLYHETFPENTAKERQWKQEYRDGKLTWSEYQEKLRTEKK